MTLSTPLSGVNQPFKGIMLIVVATFLFSSHDALSKFLSGFYPIIMVVWARYLVHTLLMAGIFLPQSGLSVLRTRRPLLQLLRALCLLGTSLFFTTGLQYIPLAEATAAQLSCPGPGDRTVGAVAGRARHPWPMDRGDMRVYRRSDHCPPRRRPVHASRVAAALLGAVFCFYQLLTRKLSDIDSPTTSNFFAGCATPW